MTNRKIPAHNNMIAMMKIRDIGDVVANVNSSESEDFITIEAPAVVQIQPTPQGQLGVMLFPALVGVDEKGSHQILKSDLVIPPSPADDKMANLYRKQFGSGLEVPEKKIQLV